MCKVEFDARCADDRLRFASEIKARNEELLALRVDRDNCVREWAAEKAAMQEEIKVVENGACAMCVRLTLDCRQRPQSCVRAAVELQSLRLP